MRGSLTVCLAGALLFAALSAGSAQDKSPESPYFPSQVGNTWHYKADNTKFSQKITKHDLIDGVPCARLETLVDGNSAFFEHVGVKDDGLYRYTLEGRKADPPVRFLKLPPKKGDSWTVESKLGGKTVKCTFKSDEEEVKVPAGTFKTVSAVSDNLEANGLKASFAFYFAKDVGMVKQVIEVSGQKKVEIELEKFEPAKK
jgi:hypothetical protein